MPHPDIEDCWADEIEDDENCERFTLRRITDKEEGSDERSEWSSL